MADEEPDECPLCGSHGANLEDDGRWYCDNGHVLDRGILIAEDEADFLSQGKVIKKREAKEKIKISRVLRGSKAYQLFLQSWQYILWKQCHALVHLKGFPDELWTVVRDLWTLWLSKLALKLEDNPAHASSASESESESGPSDLETRAAETVADGTSQTSSRNRTKPVNSGPKLVDTLALNVLGMILLHQPVGLATVFSWIQQEEIPYLRAIRFVPADMKSRLPSEYVKALDTIHILKAQDLQAAVYRLANMYKQNFGMSIPPLNHTLVLIDHVKSLALPLEVYAAVEKLNTITQYSFDYEDSSSRARRSVVDYPEVQLMSLLVVAAKLLFPFDCDNERYRAPGPNSLATLRMDWLHWLANRDRPQSHTAEPVSTLSLTEAISVTDTNVFDMTGNQLDAYMDWYQRTFIDDESSVHGRPLTSQPPDKEILDMFPLKSVPSPLNTREVHGAREQEHLSRQQERIATIQSNLTQHPALAPSEEASSTESVLRPGQRYPRFKTISDLDAATSLVSSDGAGQTAVSVVKAFHEDAARAACIDVEGLLRAVHATEEAIERWRVGRKRRELFREEDDNEEGSDDSDRAMREELDSSTLEAQLGGLDLGFAQVSGDSPRDVEMENSPHREAGDSSSRGMG